MTRPPRKDEDLDDFGVDLDALAARYEAESNGIEPAQHLDAQLLAAAHRAADAKPRVAGAPPSAAPSLLRRMRAPFGLAASIVAIASLTMAVWKESPEKLAIPSDHPLIVAPTQAPQAEQSSSPGNQAGFVLPAPASAPLPALRAPAPAPSISPAPARQRANPEKKEFESSSASTAAPRPPALAAKAAPLSEDKPTGTAAAAPARELAAQQSLDQVAGTGSNLRRAETETPSPVQPLELADTPLASAAAPAPSASAKAAVPAAPVAATTTAPPPPSIALLAPLPAPMLPAAPAPATPAPAFSVAPSAPAPRAAAPDATAPPSPPAPSIARFSAPPPAPIPPAAPAAAFSAPAGAPAAQIASNVGQAARGPVDRQDVLLAALQTAADAGDPAAARIVLETLKKNYPHAQLAAKLRDQLHRLGIALPQ